MGFDKINDLKRHNDAIADELQGALTRVLRSGWFALGPEVKAFEEEFALFLGARHTIGVANGTDAIELALRACGVRAGDDVITAANAGMYTSCAIVAIGAVPRFADVDEATLTVDPTSVEQALTRRTRAIVATHLFGRAADLPRLRALADARRIPLIEDCAQAHGARLRGRRLGSWGDAAAFSFYPTKNLGALGDGGAVVTSRDDIAEAVRELRQYGWQRRYVSVRPGGSNSRLDEIQAAVLRVKLTKLEDWNARRRELASLYSSEIHHPDVVTPPEPNEESATHLYVIRSRQRDLLREHLHQVGVAADVHYPLLDNQQPSLQGLVEQRSLRVSERAVADILTLPCYPELRDDEAMKVVEAVNGWKL